MCGKLGRKLDKIGLNSMKKQIKLDIVKVDKALGILFGYAIVCQEDGTDYYDLQGDHIPEEAMMEAAVNFMDGRNYFYENHIWGVGKVIFAWPMTSELAEAMDITVKRTGLLVGVKPDHYDIIDKFRDGIYTGFSIGGMVNAEDKPDVEDIN